MAWRIWIGSAGRGRRRHASSRNQPALFEQAAQRVIATFNAQDTMLDAIVFSRGRFAISMPGASAFVIPTGPEVARIVEDCRG